MACLLALIDEGDMLAEWGSMEEIIRSGLCYERKSQQRTSRSIGKGRSFQAKQSTNLFISKHTYMRAPNPRHIALRGLGFLLSFPPCATSHSSFVPTPLPSVGFDFFACCAFAHRHSQHLGAERQSSCFLNDGLVDGGVCTRNVNLVLGAAWLIPESHAKARTHLLEIDLCIGPHLRISN